jgi:hypothetical protein
MSKHERREEIRRWLALRTSEGLTFVELSRRSGIPSATLAWWSGRLRREESGAQPTEGSPGSSAFVELTPGAGPPPPDIERGSLELVLEHGRRLIVRPGFDEHDLLRLLRALEAAC